MKRATHPSRILRLAAVAVAAPLVAAACWSDVNEAQNSDSAAAIDSPTRPGSGAAGEGGTAPGPIPDPVDTSGAPDTTRRAPSADTAGVDSTTAAAR